MNTTKVTAKFLFWLFLKEKTRFYKYIVRKFGFTYSKYKKMPYNIIWTFYFILCGFNKVSVKFPTKQGLHFLVQNLSIIFFFVTLKVHRYLKHKFIIIFLTRFSISYKIMQFVSSKKQGSPFYHLNVQLKILIQQPALQLFNFDNLHQIFQ